MGLLTKAALAVLAIGLCIYTRRDRSITKQDVLDGYDYVIVGGGTAGSVVAARLSEDPDVTVLVLEAGRDDAEMPDTTIPHKAREVMSNGEILWNYSTVSQKSACHSMANSQCLWPRGKILGGSGSINCLIYMRGHWRDFDGWSAKFGCKGWSYREVLPYFIKSETNTNPAYARGRYHGTDGPQTVSDVNATHDNKLKDVFLAAADELGYFVGDLNAESDHSEVFMHNQVNVNNGVRHSTVRSFLRPVASRENLHIVTRAFVTKIVLDGDAATGVEYENASGEKKYARAEREVVLTSGTVGSAQILLLSGIGPREHLSKVGIRAVVDLPVGEFLQDHMFLPHLIFPIDKHMLADSVVTWTDSLKYLLFGKGILGDACGVQGNALFRSRHQPEDDPRPHYKICCVSGIKSGRENKHGRDTQQVEPRAAGGNDEPVVGILPDILRPLSSGTLRLRTSNPRDPPLIDPEYLSHPRDVRIFIEAIRTAYRIANTTAFRKIGTKLTRLESAACDQKVYDTDEYWECVVRELAQTEFHPVGTCRMGGVHDPAAVVDARLRVRGVRRLRVVDASVMPEVVSATTNAATVMIAERGADLMKEDRKTNKDK